MRVKPIPPPPDDLETVRAAQRSVPLVPGSEADCCSRLVDALDLPSRDVARTWLTFLRGLGLVFEGERGFVRTAVEPDRETLASGLETGVFGARELLSALGPGPQPADTGIEALLEQVPRWERDRDPTWRETWRTRAQHLLGWLALAGLIERRTAGFVRVSDGPES